MADLVLLSVVAAFEPDGNEGEGQESDEKNNDHDDPFLQLVSTALIQGQGETELTQ